MTRVLRPVSGDLALLQFYEVRPRPIVSGGGSGSDIFENCMNLPVLVARLAQRRRKYKQIVGFDALLLPLPGGARLG